MVRPSGSRQMNTNDPDFSDRIRRLLGYNSDAGSSDSYEEADDSDADPDWNLSREERGPLRRFPRQRSTQEEESEDEDLVLNVDQPNNDVSQNITQDSSSDATEDDENALLNLESAVVTPPQNVQQENVPEFFFERSKKTEAGPPNAWKSNPRPPPPPPSK